VRDVTVKRGGMNAWFALGRRELQLNSARKRPQQHTAGEIARWKVGAGTHKTSGQVNRCRAHWKTQSPHPPPMATYSGITCEHKPPKTNARGKHNRARIDGVIYLRVEPNLERSAKRSGHVSSTCSPETVQADVNLLGWYPETPCISPTARQGKLELRAEFLKASPERHYLLKKAKQAGAPPVCEAFVLPSSLLGPPPRVHTGPGGQ
jgi:hypothetical protein